MVFQGFSFFAMALVGVGVIAYHFYKNREAYFYDTPQDHHDSSSYFTAREISNDVKEDCNARKRKTEQSTCCSICMEHVAPRSLRLASSVIVLPCQHFFHVRCVTRWLRMNKTCPNCRAPAQIE